MIRADLIKLMDQMVPDERVLTIEEVDGISKQYKLYTEGPKTEHDKWVFERIKNNRGGTTSKNLQALTCHLINYRDVTVDDFPTLLGLKEVTEEEMNYLWDRWGYVRNNGVNIRTELFD